MPVYEALYIGQQFALTVVCVLNYFCGAKICDLDVHLITE